MIACAMVDLGIWAAPGLAAADLSGRRPKAWPGLIVVAVVLLALVSAGQAVSWAVNEALPRREMQP